jgi:hypothetical protein
MVEIDEATDLADTERMIDERIVVDEMNACVRQVVGVGHDHVLRAFELLPRNRRGAVRR